MLLRVIAKSLALRRGRLAIATLSVLLAMTLVTALFILSLEIRSKASRELEAYGANMVLVPRAMSLPAGAGGLAFGQVVAGAYLPETTLNVLKSGLIAGGLTAQTPIVPYIYTIAGRGEQRVVAAGTLFAELRALTPYWQVQGEWVDDNRDSTVAILGKNVAEKFGLHPGDEFPLQFAAGTSSFVVKGIVTVGGSEDNQVFIDLSTAQALSGRQGQLDIIQIRAPSDSLSPIARELKESIPGVEVKVVGQIAEAEKTVLFKVQLLIGLLSALVLLGSGLAVFSTMTSSVLERIKEIGLMKALGARSSQVVLIFLSESWAIGLGGGTGGILLGVGLAQMVAATVFNTYISLPVVVVPLILAIALTVTTTASLLPVREALKVEPIAALRGE